MTEHPPKDGMLWCHVCKDYAFPKTSFGTVASLDCGHVERIGGGKPTVQDYAPSRPSYQPKASRARSRAKVIDLPPSPVTPIEPPRPQGPPSRTVSGVSNIASAVRDLLNKR